jgi:hypothetical protein
MLCSATKRFTTHDGSFRHGRPTVNETGATIASSSDASLRLRLGTPRAWRSLSRDYEDAALRLKNGSCEDDEPSQVFRIALPRARGEHGRPDRVSHSRDTLIDDRTPLCAKAEYPLFPKMSVLLNRCPFS